MPSHSNVEAFARMLPNIEELDLSYSSRTPRRDLVNNVSVCHKFDESRVVVLSWSDRHGWYTALSNFRLLDGASS
jgi:hypothetical protein